MSWHWIGSLAAVLMIVGGLIVAHRLKWQRTANFLEIMGAFWPF